MKKASQLLTQTYGQIKVEFCACHKLQLVVQKILSKNITPISENEEFYFEDEDLETNEELLDEYSDDRKVTQIREVIDKCKAIASHFSRSNKANNILEKNIKLRKPNGPEKFMQANVTRWNSTFYCLERINQLKEPLIHALVDVSRDFEIERFDWVLLEKLIAILAPFEKVTKLLSADKGAFNLYLPSICHIFDILDVNNFLFFYSKLTNLIL